MTETTRCPDSDFDSSEQVNLARVDFDEWRIRNKSTDYERFIVEKKLKGSVADSLRDICKLENEVFGNPANPVSNGNSRTPFDQEGTRIGDCRLIRQLGQGGMGSVWLAEQQHPCKRQVAIKFIRPGFDSRSFVRRFEAEQQALAMMSHPNIARVLGAGTTAAGRPYFIMEYVSGTSITKYCRKHQLGLSQRLELFLDLCQAIRHAHQRGLIHRDIKPSNILVTEVDNRPTVRVIDFGLAKLCDPDGAANQPSLTTEALALGTPLWMSPEQACGNLGSRGQGIDTRSDVYSLGAVLYQLLTDTTPIRRETFLEVDQCELFRMIQEDTAPKPSARIVQSAKQIGGYPDSKWAGSVAQKANLLRRELDWIAMKALEKDRERRYESVSALMLDIRRYLDKQPVLARPPSNVYLVRKFFSRHRVVAAFCTSILSLLVVATAVSTSLAIWALNEKSIAQQEFRNQQLTIQILERILRMPLPRNILSAADESFLDSLLRMSDYVESNKSNLFDNSILTEASVNRTMGILYLELGAYDQALRHFKIASEIYTRENGHADIFSIACLHYLGRCYLGNKNYDKAIVVLDQAIERRIEKGESHEPIAIVARMQRALALAESGSSGDAIDEAKSAHQLFLGHAGEAHQKYIDMLCMLSRIQLLDDNIAEAGQTAVWLERELEKRLYHRPIDELSCRKHLVDIYTARGEIENARMTMEPAVRLAERKYGNRHLISIGLRLAFVELLIWNDEHAHAAVWADETAQITAVVLDPDHPHAIQARSQQGILTWVGQQDPQRLVLAETGHRMKQPEKRLRDVQLEGAADLLEEQLIQIKRCLGDIRCRQGRFGETRQLLESALKLADARSSSLTLEQIRIKRLLSIVLSRTGEHDKALDFARQVFAYQERLPESFDYEFVRYMEEFSDCCLGAGDFNEAIRLGRKVLKARREYFGPDETVVMDSFDSLKTLYDRCGRRDEILSLHREYLDEIIADPANHVRHEIFQRKNYAVALQLWGHDDAASEQFQKVVSLCDAQFGPLEYYSIIYLGYYQGQLLSCNRLDEALPVIMEWRARIESDSSGEQLSRLAWAKVSLADYHVQRREFTRARRLAKDVLDQNRVLLYGDRPPPQELERARSIYGLCLAVEGEYSEAEKVSLRACQRMFEMDSIKHPFYSWYLDRACGRMIEIYTISHQKEQAELWKSRLRELREQHAENFPTVSIR